MKEIFAEACEVLTDHREQFLSERCGPDHDLRREVEALLQTRESAGHFLADPSAAAQRAFVFDADEAPTDRAFDHVDQFKLLRLLGEGGFGAVYLAEQEHPVRRMVALKIIKLGMDTREVIARFQAERQALAMMDHPNIARVFDAGATETGRPYFVMELVRGVPITEYCDANRLSIRQRLELFVPVCLAVGHAHQKGVIHRDIKPSNVLVEAFDPGAPGVPKVIDFGVAKATGANLSNGTAYTGLRQIIGTLEYMSPEQADLREPAVDTRSDVYSLGALLYELLTATAPFDANLLRNKGYSEAQRIIREVHPPRPSTRLHQSADIARQAAAHRGVELRRLLALLRGDLDRIVMKCLEKDRERRYPSAVALAEDVQRYLNGQPISAGPDTSTYRLRKFVRRHKAVVAGVVGIALTMLLAVAGTTTGLFRARRAEQTVTEQRNAARAAQRLAELNAAAAQREAQRAFTVSSFLRDVFALAQPETGAGGQETNIGEVLRRAAGEIDKKLGQRPEEELLARRMLGEACGRLNLHDLAVEQFRRAHELSLSLPGGAGSVRSLDLAAQWAMAMYLAGRGNEAAAPARAALAECRRRWGDDQPVTWENMHSYALCASQTSASQETYEILKSLVEAARASPEGKRADRLGRYLCNWSICLRDRGEYDAAAAALREAAGVIQADNFDPDAHAPTTAGDGPIPGDAFRLLGDRSSDMISASGWIARAVVESGDIPEAIPLLKRYISEARRWAPQGTPAIAYRIEDLAMLRLRTGDRAGAASDLASAIDMWRGLLGYDGWQPQTRWRIWAMYCDPKLCLGWRSPAMRNQVWCALDDLLRDHPPSHLDPHDMPLDRLRFKLIRWNTNSGDSDGQLVAEGGLDQLRSLVEPAAGLYLLGLKIPRLGDEPLRKANWLLLTPWAVEFRPIVRFDSTRTEGIGRDRDRIRVISPYVYDRREMLGLALHDGLALTTEAPRRLQWFTASAAARADLPAGRYRFSVSSDDGHRLWVDGKLLSDDWGPQPSVTIDVETELTGGTHDLRADLLQEQGGYCLWLQVAPLTAAAKTAALKLGGGVPEPDALSAISGQHLADKPHDLSLRLQYANSLARAGRFREAAGQYAALIEADPTDQRYCYARTLLLAYLDNDAYQQSCRHMLDRFASSADPIAIMHLLLACSVQSRAPIGQAQLALLLDRAMAMQVAASQGELFDLAGGLASYRTGRFEQAVQHLAHFLPEEGEQSVGRATFQMILGMALEHLGCRQEADAALGDAGRFIETQGPVAGIDDLKLDFENWVICQLIWREAQTLRAGNH